MADMDKMGRCICAISYPGNYVRLNVILEPGKPGADVPNLEMIKDDNPTAEALARAVC